MTRKNKKNKNITVWSGFFVCAAIFTILLSTGFFLTFFTEYSEGFTYQKFHTIVAGQTMQEVHSMLGRPFVDSSDELPCDSYSRVSRFGGKLDFTDFTGWISVRVCYDKNNIVRDIPQNTFFN